MSTASYDAWKKQIEAQTGKTVEELCNRTMEQIDVKPLYTKEDYADCNQIEFMAGIAPNLRGPYPTMYVVLGQFVSTLASLLLRNPTLSIVVTWLLVRKACPLLLTWQPTVVMTPITSVL